jgi:hypothetical protein
VLVVGGFNTGDLDQDGLLDVNETWTYTGSYTVKQTDLTANGIDHLGVADGDGDIDNIVTADSNETGPDTASEVVYLAPVISRGSPQFNFPNDLEKIQPKLQGGGVDEFTINPNGYIYWDLFTKDASLASINLDPNTYSSGYAGLKVSIVEIWNSTGTLGAPYASGEQVIYRIYLSNEGTLPVSMANNIDAVRYDIVAASRDKGIIDLVNADPLIGDFNSFSNIENAITKSTNQFTTTPDTAGSNTFTGTSDFQKFWTSSSLTGTADGELGATVNAGGGADAVYGRNNNGVDEHDLLSGDDGNDMIEARDGGDTVYGGGGNDILFGSLGRDLLFGDSGDDILFGSYDVDEMTGGTGADTFVVRLQDLDLIKDFDAVEGDKIHLWTGKDPNSLAITYDQTSGFLFVDGVRIAQLSDSPTLTAIEISSMPWGSGTWKDVSAAPAVNAAISLDARTAPVGEEIITPDIGILADLRHFPVDQLYAS